MPRVLIFKETLLPPSETFILAQARALGRYEFVLAGLEASPNSLPLEKPLLLTKGRGRLAALRSKLYRRTGFAPLFHQHVRQFQPNLIHAHFASGGRTAIPLARALSVPLVVTLHGADITVRGAAKRYASLARAAAGFICVSEFIRDRALDAGLPPEKLTVHYIGIDRTLFRPSLEQPAEDVLFVGRLVEKKGCEYLVRAMQVVQQARPDASLTIIGDGPLRGSLEALATELKVQCRFLGILPAAAVQEHLRRTRVFCAPSVTAADGDSEGLGMVFAEAQAVGIPVVSSRHGGIAEVVGAGKTGLLVAERDFAALANSLLVLLNDPDLRARLSSAAIAHVAERFDLKHQTAQLETLYDRFQKSPMQ